MQPSTSLALRLVALVALAFALAFGGAMIAHTAPLAATSLQAFVDARPTASSTNGVTSPSATSEAGYVLPDSDNRLYSRNELEQLSDWELKVGHNEIFARHGREFEQPELAEHFATCSWYTPRYSATDYDAMPSQLNSYEQANSDLLAEIRRERGVA